MFERKGQKRILDLNLYAKYLTKRKLKLIGAYRMINERVIEDKKGNRYIVISLFLKTITGVNRETEDENYEMLTTINDKATMKRKHIFIPEKKHALDNNIDFYKRLNENETRSAYLYGRYQRLAIMESLNKRQNASEYMFIEEKNLEMLLRNIDTIYNYKIMESDELISLLNKLNNGIM